MRIREATEADIPLIVDLLKISLGESLMPKTEAFWRWKHIDNPFGKSPVLLAFDKDTLIGVRAFMRWEWVVDDQVIKTVRAVDTATHPDYQGRGIFKKLTLQLIEQCEAEGVEFIFNTPNSSSKPGYLKMGWESLGRMQLYVKPVLCINFKNDMDSMVRIKILKAPIKQEKTKRMEVNSSDAFLNWRYCSNPNIKYYSIQDQSSDPSFLTIYRLKPYRFGYEFRICAEFKNSRINNTEYNKMLDQIIKISGANIITSSQALPGFLSLSLHRGPEITIRKLSSHHNSITFRNWSPTLGDIEVF